MSMDEEKITDETRILNKSKKLGQNMDPGLTRFYDGSSKAIPMPIPRMEDKSEDIEEYFNKGQKSKKSRSGKVTDNSFLRLKKGGAVSASSRADGIAQRGKTRGKMR